VILVATVVGSTVGWFIDRAADHPAPASAPERISVVIEIPVWVGASSASVVAVSSPRDLVVDIGPAVTQSGVPSNIRLPNAPPLPVGRTSIRLSHIGTPPPTNCHAGETQQLAASVIKPGTRVMVRAVEVATSGVTVDMWRMDGADVSTQLIAAGVAPMWIGPGGAVLGVQSAAMRVAQDEHLGIWAPCPTSG
jgi:hypothetical protein